MGKSAMDKFREADELQKMANKLTKSDPSSANDLKSLARNKRKTAIRQMKRRPTSKRINSVIR